MKIMFIVQGEGRGHLTQAIAMEDLLTRNGHEVVRVLVGKSNMRSLPAFFERSIKAPVDRFLSPNFLPSPANKRPSLMRSIVYNVVRLPRFIRSMRYLRRAIDESGAELVINFYELLTGLTYLLFRPSVPQISIGHQYLFLHRDFEFPAKDRLSLWLLRFFTRMTSIGASDRLALSFREMPDDLPGRIRVVPPLLRKEVLTCEPTDGDYIHGYMVNSGFGENVRAWHSSHPETPLHFFWDKKDAPTVCRVDETLHFHQLDDVKFLKYMAACRAYATTAGFESVCEAMYFGKPLLMVPAHIEQECNAHDAALGGAGIASDDFDLDRLKAFADSYRPDPTFRYWVRSSDRRIMDIIDTLPHPPQETATSAIFPSEPGLSGEPCF